MIFVPVESTFQAPANGGFAVQMTDGVQPREVYQNSRLLAKGIEVVETVSGSQHFFSHSETQTGTAEVDAWTDKTGRPVKASYLKAAGGAWVRTTVQVADDKVLIDRTSSDENLNRNVVFPLAKNRSYTLAQFDPLKLLSASSDQHREVSIIDAESMSLVDASLVERTDGSSGQNRSFSLSVSSTTSQIVLSGDGKFVGMQDGAGKQYVPVPWTMAYLDMADRVGIHVDPQIRAQLLANSILGCRRHG